MWIEPGNKPPPPLIGISAHKRLIVCHRLILGTELWWESSLEVHWLQEPPSGRNILTGIANRFYVTWTRSPHNKRLLQFKWPCEANYILMTACVLQTGASCITCIYADSGRSPWSMTSVKLGERMEAIVRKNHGCCLSRWSFIKLWVTWCHWPMCRQHTLLIVSTQLISCLNFVIIVVISCDKDKNRCGTTKIPLVL